MMSLGYYLKNLGCPSILVITGEKVEDEPNSPVLAGTLISLLPWLFMILPAASWYLPDISIFPLQFCAGKLPSGAAGSCIFPTGGTQPGVHGTFECEEGCQWPQRHRALNLSQVVGPICCHEIQQVTSRGSIAYVSQSILCEEWRYTGRLDEVTGLGQHYKAQDQETRSTGVWGDPPLRLPTDQSTVPG